MDISWISILFGAFGLGVLQLLWEAYKFYVIRKDKKESAEDKFANKQVQIESLFNDLIESAVAIQDSIENFVAKHDVARVLVMRMENGGGIPQLGTVQHISVINEAINTKHKSPSSKIKPIKHNFQSYVVGAEYQRLLLNVIQNDVIEIATSDLEEGILKNVYSSQDITNALIFQVTHVPTLGNISKGFMIYVSVEFTDPRVLDDLMKADYIILREKIRKIFHEFYVMRIEKFENL